MLIMYVLILFWIISVSIINIDLYISRNRLEKKYGEVPSVWDMAYGDDNSN